MLDLSYISRIVTGEEKPNDEQFGLPSPLAEWENEDDEDDDFWIDKEYTPQGPDFDYSTPKATTKTRDQSTTELGIPAVLQAQLENENSGNGFNVDRWENKWQDQNGRIPASELVKVAGVHRLSPGAAAAFKAMKRAAKKDGVNITLTDSYRDYATQVRLAQEKGLYSQGGLAAEPGTSDHGLGHAIDVAEGREWIQRNGARYGWVMDTPREDWHYGFKGWDGKVPEKRGHPRKRNQQTRTKRMNQVQNYDFDLDDSYTPASITGVLVGMYGEKVAPDPKAAAPTENVPDYVPDEWKQLIKRAAHRNGVAVGLLASVGMEESGYSDDVIYGKRDSSAGAQGMFQIMPLHGLDNPYDPRENAMYGAKYLGGLIKQFNGNIRHALAAYNAGPNSRTSNPDAWASGLAYADRVIERWRG